MFMKDMVLRVALALLGWSRDIQYSMYNYSLFVFMNEKSLKNIKVYSGRNGKQNMLQDGYL